MLRCLCFTVKRNKMELNSIFEKLQQSIVLTHYWHLRTTSYAQHMALGAFYETMPGLTDAFAEAHIGKYGERPAIPASINLDKPEEPVVYLKQLGEVVDMYITMYNKSLDCQDHLLDIRNLINKTLYLLTLS